MVVNQNVNTSNLLLVRSGASQMVVNPSNGTSDTKDFSDVLAASSQKDTECTQTRQDVKTSKTDTSSVTSKESVQKPAKKEENGNLSQTSDVDTSSEVQPLEQVEPIVDVQPEEMITEEEMEAISGLLMDVLTVVTNQLQISLEDVRDHLEAMEMDVADLLTQDGIKNFFLNVKSIDTSDLLVNENMNQDFQNLMQDWNRILDDSDYTSQEITELIDLPGVDNLVEAVLSDVVSSVETVTTDMLKEANQKSEQKITLKDQEPEVIVTKQDNPDKMELQTSEDTKEQMQKSEQEAMTDTTHEKISEPVMKDAKEFTNPILQNIQEALERVDEVVKQEGTVDSKQVVEQIVQQVKIHMNQSSTSMELQLYPEHLGRIQIHVVSKDGVMTARIAAETEQAKQAIENGLANLKEAFEQQDLKVDAVEVMVAMAGFEKGDERQNTQEQSKAGNKTRKLSFSDIEEDASEEEDAEAERMKLSGNSVSYTA